MNLPNIQRRMIIHRITNTSLCVEDSILNAVPATKQFSRSERAYKKFVQIKSTVEKSFAHISWKSRRVHSVFRRKIWTAAGFLAREGTKKPCKERKPNGEKTRGWLHIFLRNTLCAMPATTQPESAKLNHDLKERIWKKHLISKKN